MAQGTRNAEVGAMLVVISDLLGRWFWWPVRVRTRPARRGPVPALTGVVAGKRLGGDAARR